jgi:uncharacterized UBP type Zn finger protein
LNGVTKETVEEKILRRWAQGKLNSDTHKFFELGITNQCFGILQGIKVKCEKRHVRYLVSSSVFLVLSEEKGSTIEEMIENEYSYQESDIFCKECNKEVITTYRKKILSLPKSMFVVVDRFNKNDALVNLLKRVPKAIELRKHLNKDLKKLRPESKFLLSGFIFQDPNYEDYGVVLKNKKR